MEAAFTGDSCPWELTQALICREFHVLPEQLAQQPADAIIRMWKVLTIYDNIKAKKTLA